ncbi:MAG: WcaF family extracellular polysaccharide biosynthesis acetyltransferase [Verrucomicrobiota bacterium]|nr:WcaF family extracellular polysaccharide biosynthesis acetyltransferase [Verrucomicrobiota bacterium]
MNLALFDNSDFDRGAPRWKEALWFLARWMFFQNALPWPSELRVALLRAFGARIGNGVVIRPNVNISMPWRLTIGAHVWIGEDVGIHSFAPVTIGSNSCVSQRAYLCTGSHDRRREDFPLKCAPITLADQVWVAAMSFIAPGVTIGSGAVVAAGSVVFCNVAAGALVRGNPAEEITTFKGGGTN